MTIENTKAKPIAKPVYFNITNDKEKEMVEWIDSKFSTFGGLVKDLLYKEMINEKNGFKNVLIKDSDIANSNKSIEDIPENNVDSSEVEDVEC